MRSNRHISTAKLEELLESEKIEVLSEGGKNVQIDYVSFCIEPSIQIIYFKVGDTTLYYKQTKTTQEKSGLTDGLWLATTIKDLKGFLEKNIWLFS